MVIGLVSCFREGRLAADAIRTALDGCDHVIVFEGPVAGSEAAGPESALDSFTRSRKVTIIDGEWEDDAAKRTAMLNRARLLVESATPRAKRELSTGPVWIVWIDGDEALIYGDMLPAMLDRAEYEVTGGGGMPLRIVELDGSVAMCYGKVISLNAVERYIVSSYHVKLTQGIEVSLPNVPICRAGGYPLGEQPNNEHDLDQWLGRHRAPLMGEPHLLHRSMLRSPERTAPRLHEREAQWFENKVEGLNL